jgi:hypothetical protein
MPSRQTPNAAAAMQKHQYVREAQDGRCTKPRIFEINAHPSHLEAVDPVVVGFARARLMYCTKAIFDKILPILIHMVTHRRRTGYCGRNFTDDPTYQPPHLLQRDGVQVILSRHPKRYLPSSLLAISLLICYCKHGYNREMIRAIMMSQVTCHTYNVRHKNTPDPSLNATTFKDMRRNFADLWNVLMRINKLLFYNTII